MTVVVRQVGLSFRKPQIFRDVHDLTEKGEPQLFG